MGGVSLSALPSLQSPLCSCWAISTPAIFWQLSFIYRLLEMAVCAPLQVFHSLCNGSLLSETKQAEASCLQSSRGQAVWLQQKACHNFTYISQVWSIKNIYNSISRHSRVYRSSTVHILFLQMLNSVPLVQRKLQFFPQVYVAWWCKLSECLFSKINVFALIKSP